MSTLLGTARIASSLCVSPKRDFLYCVLTFTDAVILLAIPAMVTSAGGWKTSRRLWQKYAKKLM
jgi:hypothetical protein